LPKMLLGRRRKTRKRVASQLVDPSVLDFGVFDTQASFIIHLLFFGVR
jgi:hypothetical protein